jgi:hypothetical protein
MSENGGWQALMKANEMALVVALRADGTNVLRVAVGDLSDHISRLENSLFGDPAEIGQLAASLEGQILPRWVRLGPVDCFVSRCCNGDVVFGVFTTHRPTDPAERYARGERLADLVGRELEKRV